ncbi:hypothetical protein FQN55_005784 [Onygenales sp. PD_40]|nr:hypothetical protein FQN55_005784 [Onygenales sp. PD_40]
MTTTSDPPSSRLHSIIVVGSGGVGTIATLVLEKSRRARVTAVLRCRYAVVKEKGWNIDSVDHGKLAAWKPSRVVSTVTEAVEAETEPFDYIVVTTKQLPDIFSIPDIIRPAVTPGLTTVVLIQNGLDIELPIIEAFPTNTVMSSISMIGSRTEGENGIFQLGPDIQTIGPHFHDGLDRAVQLQKARQFVEIYTAGSKGAGAKDAEMTFSEDMPVARWQKLLWNSTFNTLCTLMDMNVGELQSSGGRETLLIPAMWEIYAIAKAAGHPPPEEMIQIYAYRLPNDCPYRPSMLLDRDHRRPMELEVLLGRPLQRAKELGVPTPVLSTVYEALKMVRWKIEQESGGMN